MDEVLLEGEEFNVLDHEADFIFVVIGVDVFLVVGSDVRAGALGSVEVVVVAADGPARFEPHPEVVALKFSCPGVETTGENMLVIHLSFIILFLFARHEVAALVLVLSIVFDCCSVRIAAWSGIASTKVGVQFDIWHFDALDVLLAELGLLLLVPRCCLLGTHALPSGVDSFRSHDAPRTSLTESLLLIQVYKPLGLQCRFSGHFTATLAHPPLLHRRHLLLLGRQQWLPLGPSPLCVCLLIMNADACLRSHHVLLLGAARDRAVLSGTSCALLANELSFRLIRCYLSRRIRILLNRLRIPHRLRIRIFLDVVSLHLILY